MNAEAARFPLGAGSSDPDLQVEPASLLGAVPEAIVVVSEGIIRQANPAAEVLTHSEGGGLVGRAILDLLPGWRADAEMGIPFETVCLLPDGKELPLQVRLGPAAGSPPARIAALRDARALVAGREAEALYRSLVEQIPAIVYVDHGGEGTTFVSPQIETIFGVTAEEYCNDGDLWRRLLHPEDRERIVREYAAFVEGTGGDLSDYRVLTPDGRVVWIRDRAQAIRDEDGRLLLEHGFMFDITELKEAEAQIAHLAYHDRLTGLPNRSLFEETLELAIHRAVRYEKAVAVLYLDLDNFKLVNDSMGHHIGDQLLRELADRLRTCTRDSDLVARQGGDEFLLLMPEIDRTPIPGTDRDPAAVVAEQLAGRVLEALQTPFQLGETTFHASGSIGISVYPADALDGETLMKHADAAMYRAKRLEPGGHSFFAEGEEDAQAMLTFGTRLRQAVQDENWVLHYQPVVDLADGRMVGAEALIRWQEVSGGIVPPGEFIPVAEELGLIEAIGDWVIDETARQQREWADAGLDIELSFNLSPRQLWSARLAEKIIGRLNHAGVDVGSIVVEITESTAMTEPDRTQKILSELHAWGVRLALDDFGTGYSSLARLKHMPVDILKIDRAFVRDVHADVRLAGMVRAMIQLAQSLEMIPLAEGIETEAELVFLRANGCRLAQGFHFARPVPASEIPDLAARSEGLFPASLTRPA